MRIEYAEIDNIHSFRVEDYKGGLPNPRKFPTTYVAVYRIEDMPRTFSDGYILELNVDDKDVDRLNKRVLRVVPKGQVDGIIKKVMAYSILLSEPVYIYLYLTSNDFIAYILFTPDDWNVAIQVKYYRYFRNRYPKCQFYTSEDLFDEIGVWINKKLVGIVMPSYVPVKLPRPK